MKRKITKIVLLLFVIVLLFSACMKEPVLRIETEKQSFLPVYIYKVSDTTYDQNSAYYGEYYSGYYSGDAIDRSKYDTSIMEEKEIYVVDRIKRECNDKISFHVQVSKSDPSSQATVPSQITVSGSGTIKEISKVFRPQKTDKTDTYIISYYTPVYRQIEAISLGFSSLKEAENTITKTTFETVKSNVTIFYE